MKLTISWGTASLAEDVGVDVLEAGGLEACDRRRAESGSSRPGELHALLGVTGQDRLIGQDGNGLGGVPVLVS